MDRCPPMTGDGRQYSTSGFGQNSYGYAQDLRHPSGNGLHSGQSLGSLNYRALSAASNKRHEYVPAFRSSQELRNRSTRRNIYDTVRANDWQGVQLPRRPTKFTYHSVAVRENPITGTVTRIYRPTQDLEQLGQPQLTYARKRSNSAFLPVEQWLPRPAMVDAGVQSEFNDDTEPFQPSFDCYIHEGFGRVLLEDWESGNDRIKPEDAVISSHAGLADTTKSLVYGRQEVQGGANDNEWLVETPTVLMDQLSSAQAGSDVMAALGYHRVSRQSSAKTRSESEAPSIHTEEFSQPRMFVSAGTETTEDLVDTQGSAKDTLDSFVDALSSTQNFRSPRAILDETTSHHSFDSAELNQWFAAGETKSSTRLSSVLSTSSFLKHSIRRVPLREIARSSDSISAPATFACCVAELEQRSMPVRAPSLSGQKATIRGPPARTATTSNKERKHEQLLDPVLHEDISVPQDAVGLIKLLRLQVPVSPPAAAVPVSPPAAAVPVSPPAAAVPVSPPAAAVPVSPPAAVVPVSPPAAAVPVSPPAAAVPVSPPAAVVPVSPPAAAVPVSSPAAASSVIPPTTAAPPITSLGATPPAVSPPPAAEPISPPVVAPPVILPAAASFTSPTTAAPPASLPPAALLVTPPAVAPPVVSPTSAEKTPREKEESDVKPIWETCECCKLARKLREDHFANKLNIASSLPPTTSSPAVPPTNASTVAQPTIASTAVPPTMSGAIPVPTTASTVVALPTGSTVLPPATTSSTINLTIANTVFPSVVASTAVPTNTTSTVVPPVSASTVLPPTIPGTVVPSTTASTVLPPATANTDPTSGMASVLVPPALPDTVLPSVLSTSPPPAPDGYIHIRKSDYDELIRATARMESKTLPQSEIKTVQMATVEQVVPPVQVPIVAPEYNKAGEPRLPEAPSKFAERKKQAVETGRTSLLGHNWLRYRKSCIDILPASIIQNGSVSAAPSVHDPASVKTMVPPVTTTGQEPEQMAPVSQASILLRKLNSSMLKSEPLVYPKADTLPSAAHSEATVVRVKSSPEKKSASMAVNLDYKSPVKVFAIGVTADVRKPAQEVATMAPESNALELNKSTAQGLTSMTPEFKESELKMSFVQDVPSKAPESRIAELGKVTVEEVASMASESKLNEFEKPNVQRVATMVLELNMVERKQSMDQETFTMVPESGRVELQASARREESAIVTENRTNDKSTMQREAAFMVPENRVIELRSSGQTVSMMASEYSIRSKGSSTQAMASMALNTNKRVRHKKSTMQGVQTVVPEPTMIDILRSHGHNVSTMVPEFKLVELEKSIQVSEPLVADHLYVSTGMQHGLYVNYDVFERLDEAPIRDGVMPTTLVDLSASVSTADMVTAFSSVPLNPDSFSSPRSVPDEVQSKTSLPTETTRDKKSSGPTKQLSVCLLKLPPGQMRAPRETSSSKPRSVTIESPITSRMPLQAPSVECARPYIADPAVGEDISECKVLLRCPSTVIESAMNPKRDLAFLRKILPKHKVSLPRAEPPLEQPPLPAVKPTKTDRASVFACMSSSEEWLSDPSFLMESDGGICTPSRDGVRRQAPQVRIQPGTKSGNLQRVTLCDDDDKCPVRTLKRKCSGGNVDAQNEQLFPKFRVYSYPVSEAPMRRRYEVPSGSSAAATSALITPEYFSSPSPVFNSASPFSPRYLPHDSSMVRGGVSEPCELKKFRPSEVTCSSMEQSATSANDAARLYGGTSTSKEAFNREMARRSRVAAHSYQPRSSSRGSESLHKRYEIAARVSSAVSLGNILSAALERKSSTYKKLPGIHGVAANRLPSVSPLYRARRIFYDDEDGGQAAEQPMIIFSSEKGSPRKRKSTRVLKAEGPPSSATEKRRFRKSGSKGESPTSVRSMHVREVTTRRPSERSPWLGGTDGRHERDEETEAFSERKDDTEQRDMDHELWHSSSHRSRASTPSSRVYARHDEAISDEEELEDHEEEELGIEYMAESYEEEESLEQSTCSPTLASICVDSTYDEESAGRHGKNDLDLPSRYLQHDPRRSSKLPTAACSVASSKSCRSSKAQLPEPRRGSHQEVSTHEPSSRNTQRFPDRATGSTRKSNASMERSVKHTPSQTSRTWSDRRSSRNTIDRGTYACGTVDACTSPAVHATTCLERRSGFKTAIPSATGDSRRAAVQCTSVSSGTSQARASQQVPLKGYQAVKQNQLRRSRASAFSCTFRN